MEQDRNTMCALSRFLWLLCGGWMMGWDRSENRMEAGCKMTRVREGVTGERGRRWMGEALRFTTTSV